MTCTGCRWEDRCFSEPETWEFGDEREHDEFMFDKVRCVEEGNSDTGGC
jgi:hypothetical protein